MVTFASIYTEFYRISPYIFIKDFGLTAKVYASYLFIPTAGYLIGNIFTPIIKKGTVRVDVSFSVSVLHWVPFLVLWLFFILCLIP